MLEINFGEKFIVTTFSLPFEQYITHMPNLIVIFLTGLFTGGITCAAVQGGLLMGVLANTPTDSNQKERSRIKLMMIVLAFVISKLLAYTVLGCILGFLGATFQFSVQFTGFMLGIASFFMIGLALNMLSVHPIFKKFVITTPKVLRSFVWKESKRADFFAPIILGALTIFIPCGVTQAMMAEAIGYGNALTGALILFSFVLGTTPLFLLFGLAITTVSQQYKQWFEKIAAIIIIGMALWNLYNVSTIFGLNTSIGSILKPISCQFIYCEDSAQQSSIVREVTKSPTISIRQTTYEIDNPYIKAGDSITLTVKNIDGGGCIQFFTIPKLGIQKSIPVGKTEKFTFIAPSEKGELTYTCSMGMYRGEMIVE
jgi:sulfite exporter TauE/SafE